MTSFDASKVERKTGVLDDANAYAGETEDVFVRASDFDACAAALYEACAEVEKLKGIVREYRNAHAGEGCLSGCVDTRCDTCKRADEVLERR